MPTLITRPFAESGDKVIPPLSDNFGFVNFAQGYTPDYELDLESGDADAKAVDRLSQNGLFNLITDNLKYLQDHGYQMWFSGNTYNANDTVIHNGFIYRCRNANVTTTPSSDYMINGTYNYATNSAKNWERIPFPSELIKAIPFPVGGDTLNNGVPSTSFAVASQNLRAAPYLNKGFIVVPTDEVAVTLINAPTPVNGTAKAGYIEIVNWAANGNKLMQRYTMRDGSVFVCWQEGTTWTSWSQLAKASDVQMGVFNFANAASTAANVINLTPLMAMPTPFQVGAKLVFKSPITNTGPVTINVGGSSVGVLGMDNQPVPKNVILNGLFIEITWDGANWVVTKNPGGQQVIPKATEPTAAARFDQLQEVDAKILSFDDIIPVGRVLIFGTTVNPNTTYPGTTWEALPDGFLLATDASVAPLTTSGDDQVTVKPANLPKHDHAVSLTTLGASNAGTTVRVSSTDLGTKASTPAGAHNHSVAGTAAYAGDHQHGISIDPNGQHNHGGGTGVAGAHQHMIELSANKSGTGRADGASTGSRDGEQYTSIAGDHAHAIVPDGYHSHGAAIGIAGGHTHTVTGAASDVGNHTHNVVIGAHDHTFGAPDHNHNINGRTQPTGSDNPDPITINPKRIAIRAWIRTA